MEIFSKDGLWGAFVAAHVIVAVMWMGLLWFFNFVQTPGLRGDGRRAPATTRSTSSPGARCGGSAGPRWRPSCSGCSSSRSSGKRHLQRRLLEVDAPASRCSIGILFGAHDALQRVDDHLAEPADRHRQRAQRAGRRRGRPQRGRPRRAPARWRHGRTRSSRCRCSSSWSARRTSTASSHFSFRPGGGQVVRLPPDRDRRARGARG